MRHKGQIAGRPCWCAKHENAPLLHCRTPSKLLHSRNFPEKCNLLQLLYIKAINKTEVFQQFVFWKNSNHSNFGESPMLPKLKMFCRILKRLRLLVFQVCAACPSFPKIWLIKKLGTLPTEHSLNTNSKTISITTVDVLGVSWWGVHAGSP